MTICEYQAYQEQAQRAEELYDTLRELFGADKAKNYLRCKGRIYGAITDAEYDLLRRFE